MSKSESFYGTCKLCLTHTKLCESHLLPRGVYVHSRGPENTPPLIVDAGGERPSQHQYKQYLLCTACEQKFNDGGERYVLGLMSNRNHEFRLLELLKASPVTFKGELWCQFSAADTPLIDRARLVYFAISVFWRASVASWKDANGDERVRINLGRGYNEELRKYLLGETDVPNLAFLVVYVCSDAASASRSFAPHENAKTKVGKLVGFLIRGIEFSFGIGKGVPLFQRHLSLTNSGSGWIHLRDCKEYRMWYLESPNRS